MVLLTPSDALQTVAHFIRITRLTDNITLEDLAKRSGISTATLSRLEKRGVCSTENLVRVLAALGVLDRLTSAFSPLQSDTIADLRKYHAPKPRQRARKKE
jgi:transcriptional regulator with XRE-family HTH domain